MKTRRFLGWVAMAAMFLGTGCSSDEVVNDYSPENAIQFGTYVGRDASSRGTVITTGGGAVENGPQTTDALTEKGFGVFAYYTGTESFDASTHQPNFMYNQEVHARKPSTQGTVAEGDGEGASEGTTTPTTYDWTYSPVKYWPNNTGEKISFFAYAPYYNHLTSTSTTDATASSLSFSGNDAVGMPVVTYTVGSDVKGHQDLLWAAPAMNKTKQKVDENVSFTFNHALSRIGFKVQAMVDKVNADDMNKDTEDDKKDDDVSGNGTLDGNTHIIVKKVTLSGWFPTEGELKWEVGENSSYEAKVTPKGNATAKANYVLSAGSSSDDTNFAIVTTNTYPKPTEGEEAIEGSYSEYGQEATITESKLNADDSYIMVIPKNFTGEDKVTIEIEYDVVTIDPNLEKGYVEIENKISSDFNFNFEQGKAYTFSLHLGMTSVKLTADVNGWTDGGEWAVNVQLNTTTAPSNP